MLLEFLGTGTSHGVPVIACGCRVCGSPDPRDRRWRCSLSLRSGDTNIVIDAGPEFRLQAIRGGIRSLDALLLTHAHADHIHGIDDVRPLLRGVALPVHGDEACLAELRERFAYAFRAGPQEGGGKPRLDLRPTDGRSITIGSICALPLPVEHGLLTILGWKIGPFAWISDCSGIPEPTMHALRGGSDGVPVTCLAIGALRERPHPTHFSIDGALEAARRIGATSTWLIHLTHDHSHAELEGICRARGDDVGARPAWDGLQLDIPG